KASLSIYGTKQVGFYVIINPQTTVHFILYIGAFLYKVKLQLAVYDAFSCRSQYINQGRGGMPLSSLASLIIVVLFSDIQ
ncbi:hypothetical protein ACYRBH_14970, partial [Listeria monocytogenes]